MLNILWMNNTSPWTNHTDHKSIALLHEQSLYVFWDLLSILTCNHTDHKSIALLHEQSLYVFWDLLSYISMNSVYMSFESSFLCCLVITLITTISCIISMKRLNVSSCQSSWCYWSPKLTFHRRQRLEDLDSRDHRTSGWTKLLALFMRVK